MRQELVQSAVQFLTDPQVAGATLEKRLEFLRSKNMTQEEIDEALRQAQEHDSSSESSQAPSESSHNLRVQSLPHSMPPRAPPPIPQRDWKDYFVMATVSVGVAYGLYQVARRYVLPMIVPPTPPALEADKQALEAEFTRMEALVEQLAKDTEDMKHSEAQRSEQFASLMVDARQAVDAVTQQGEERRSDMRALRSHVDALGDLLPKALAKHKEAHEVATRELHNELRSLKHLVTNRTKSSGVPPASAVPSVPRSAAMTPAVPLNNSTSGNQASQAPFIPTPGEKPNEARNDAKDSESVPSIPSWQLPSS